jgi:hypothetical protein
MTKEQADKLRQGDYRIMPLTEWRNWQRGWE